MPTIKCGSCKKELTSKMEVEYSSWINEFFCSFDCAESRYFEYMNSVPVDFENTLPEGVAINDNSVMVKVLPTIEAV